MEPIQAVSQRSGASSRSSTLTFINIPLGPPGATDPPTPPPPHWKISCCCYSRLQLSLKQNGLCSWLARFSKTLISVLPSPWRQSPLADDRVIAGRIPDSQRRRDIYDSDDQTGRFRAKNIKALLEAKVFDLGPVSSCTWHQGDVFFTPGSYQKVHRRMQDSWVQSGAGGGQTRGLLSTAAGSRLQTRPASIRQSPKRGQNPSGGPSDHSASQVTCGGGGGGGVPVCVTRQTC